MSNEAQNSKPQEQEVLDYIKESNEHMLALSEENKELKAKVAQLEEEKVTLQKVASAPAFGPTEAGMIVDALKPTQFIPSEQETKVASVLQKDPLYIVELFKKLAAAVEQRPHGRGVTVHDESKEADESDPDGWNKLAEAYPS